MKDRNPKDDAIIIVDMQVAFSIPPAVITRVKKYADQFPRRVFTRFINPPGSLFRRKLKQHSCEPGSKDLELVVPPKPGDLVLEKNGYGLNARHIRQLKKEGVRSAVVCGVDTDACVLGVMFSLFDAEIVPHLKESLCWSSNGLQKEALKILRAQFPRPR